MTKVIFGKKGKGKTTYCKSVIDRSVLPVLVFDVLNEYQDRAVLQKLPSPGLAWDMIYFKTRFFITDQLDFDQACLSLLHGPQQPGLNLILDEIDMHTSSQLLPDPFFKLLKYSRHFNINLFLSVRNPVECNRKISALADRFIIFNLTEPRYLDYFKQYDLALPGLIKALKKYQYIEWDLGS